MVSERNEGREGGGGRGAGGGQGLKYTSQSSRRYEMLLPPSAVGLSTAEQEVFQTPSHLNVTGCDRNAVLDIFPVAGKCAFGF